MNSSDSANNQPPRPEFMVVLGLLPPYTEADVHRAYLEKAKSAHPDHGGQTGDFHKLHVAFESAMHYVEHRTDKRSWIAAQVNRYVQQNEAVDQLRELGAELEFEVIDWLRKSFGDFAELTEKLVAVRLDDSPRGDQLLDVLADNRKAFSGLRRLEMRRCRVTDKAIAKLAGFEYLRQIDLEGNPIGKRSTPLFKSLPALEQLVLKGTNYGWFARRGLPNVIVDSLD